MYSHRAKRSKSQQIDFTRRKWRKTKKYTRERSTFRKISKSRREPYQESLITSENFVWKFRTEFHTHFVRINISKLNFTRRGFVQNERCPNVVITKPVHRRKNAGWWKQHKKEPRAYYESLFNNGPLSYLFWYVFKSCESHNFLPALIFINVYFDKCEKSGRILTRICIHCRGICAKWQSSQLWHLYGIQIRQCPLSYLDSYRLMFP